MRLSGVCKTAILALLLAFGTAFALHSSYGAPAQEQNPPGPTRDPQAISILTQAVNAAGGAAAISAIQDFTETGTVIYYWGTGPAQGSVVIKGRGLGQFRLDATLSDGVHSWIVSNGKATQEQPGGSIAPWLTPLTLKPVCITLPLLHLSAALQDVSWNISYIGLGTHGGKQLHDVRLQRRYSAANDPTGFRSSVTTEDFFIDPETYLLVSTEDKAYRKDGTPGTAPHEIQFSNYQTASAVLVPLSIMELIGPTQTIAIQLNHISFNAGLTDSDF